MSDVPSTAEVLRLAELLSPEKQFKKDKSGVLAHSRALRKDFALLLAALQPIYAKTVALLPGTSPEVLKSRGRAFVKLIKENPQVTAFQDQYVGTVMDNAKAFSWRNAILALLRDLSLKVLDVKSAKEKLNALAINGYQSLEMSKSQGPLRKSLPEQLRAFLPTNVVVEVDENGYISQVTDRFENEQFTLGEKIKRLRQILSQYNAIVKKVKADLTSTDEITKLSALITAIIMETGIRPGQEGNSAFKTVNGERIEVETFGAVTLGPSHVRFVRDSFTELEFIGKKGGLNTATLTDSQIIHVLQEYVEKAMTTGSKFVFVTADGKAVSYKALQKYFNDRFKGINPTDFRKLKATETVLNSLRDQQEDLYQRIRDFAKDESQNLAQRVVELLVRTIELAMKQAQTALSHDSVDTTRGAYIDPQVLLAFLSTGRASASMQDAILDSKIQLSFDPMKFIEVANARTVAAAILRKKASLRDVMEAVEADLDEGFLKMAADEYKPKGSWIPASKDGRSSLAHEIASIAGAGNHHKLKLRNTDKSNIVEVDGPMADIKDMMTHSLTDLSWWKSGRNVPFGHVTKFDTATLKSGGRNWIIVFS